MSACPRTESHEGGAYRRSEQERSKSRSSASEHANTGVKACHLVRFGAEPLRDACQAIHSLRCDRCHRFKAAACDGSATPLSQNEARELLTCDVAKDVAADHTIQGADQLEREPEDEQEDPTAGGVRRVVRAWIAAMLALVVWSFGRDRAVASC